MYWKIALNSAALVGIALLGSSPSFAAQRQQPAPRADSAAELAGSGTLGVNTKTYSAIVNVDGSLALGPAGTSSDDFGCGCGIYEVIFPSDISACAYTATIGDALADVPAPGLVNVTERFLTPPGVYVQTFDVNGNQNNHPFHIHVQC